MTKEEFITAYNIGHRDGKAGEYLPCDYPEFIEQEPCGDCIYCHEDSDGYVKPIEKNRHAFIRFGMDGWEISLSAKGWNGSAKIMYCPMCGRKLMSHRGR